ncbi:hypothetical protein TGPRC2_261390 [Toxoplasma gondii TgCatPRC2]|uniref:Uncharacterized protein n=1 Tax=Toxoplasma gondii TgCatPRC2 TaxID=1130821 RepID=A0A151HMI2_TOXGO|nr:hypothetical protein TGPRC2_261390 [Toxoplasma gondii TgCatPRC2]
MRKTRGRSSPFCLEKVRPQEKRCGRCAPSIHWRTQCEGRKAGFQSLRGRTTKMSRSMKRQAGWGTRTHIKRRRNGKQFSLPVERYRKSTTTLVSKRLTQKFVWIAFSHVYRHRNGPTHRTAKFNEGAGTVFCKRRSRKCGQKGPCKTRKREDVGFALVSDFYFTTETAFLGSMRRKLSGSGWPVLNVAAFFHDTNPSKTLGRGHVRLGYLRTSSTEGRRTTREEESRSERKNASALCRFGSLRPIVTA